MILIHISYSYSGCYSYSYSYSYYSDSHCTSLGLRRLAEEHGLHLGEAAALRLDRRPHDDPCEACEEDVEAQDIQEAGADEVRT